MGYLLCVGLGGMLGSMARFALYALARRAAPDCPFPIATLLVNVAGAFAIGLVLGSTRAREWSEGMRLFVGMGLLGGFTTFSAFAQDTLVLWEYGRATMAFANVLAHFVVALGAAAAGVALARSLTGGGVG